jgi:hypothetical protein
VGLSLLGFGVVVEAGEVLVHGRVLTGQADQLPHLVGLAHHVVPADLRVPGIGREEGGQDAYGRGFSGAVGAEQTEDTAGADGQVDPGQTVEFLVSFMEQDNGDLASIKKALQDGLKLAGELYSQPQYNAIINAAKDLANKVPEIKGHELIGSFMVQITNKGGKIETTWLPVVGKLNDANNPAVQGVAATEKAQALQDERVASFRTVLVGRADQFNSPDQLPSPGSREHLDTDYVGERAPPGDGLGRGRGPFPGRPAGVEGTVPPRVERGDVDLDAELYRRLCIVAGGQVAVDPGGEH